MKLIIGFYIFKLSHTYNQLDGLTVLVNLKIYVNSKYYLVSYLVCNFLGANLLPKVYRPNKKLNYRINSKTWPGSGCNKFVSTGNNQQIYLSYFFILFFLLIT